MELHHLAAEWATDQMIKLFRGAHLAFFFCMGIQASVRRKTTLSSELQAELW